MEDRLLSRGTNRGDHGLLLAHNPMRAGGEYSALSLLSARYKTTEPFSAGILASIMERPGDCQCTWTPAYKTGVFTLKYPSRNCRYHSQYVRGRIV